MFFFPILLQEIKRVTLITSQIIKTQKVNANLMNCDLPQEKVNAEEGYFAICQDLLLYCTKITLYAQLSGSSE